MEFPTEYTGAGSCWPHIWKSWFPSSEATLVIKIRAPWLSEIHALFWPGSKVKLKKVSLMMRPVGTVIFQVQFLFAGKLFGKFGLVNNPLDPLRKSPGGTHAAKEIKRWNVQRLSKLPNQPYSGLTLFRPGGGREGGFWGPPQLWWQKKKKLWRWRWLVFTYVINNSRCV